MILTPHAIVGATLTNLFPSNPEVGFSLAFMSHYFLDMIPHAEYSLSGFIEDKKEKADSISYNLKSAFKPLLFIGIDLTIGIVLSYFIFVRDEQSLYLTIGGVFFAVLPDFLQTVYLKFKNRFWTKVQRVHEIFHGENKYKRDWVKGGLTQIVTVAFFLLIYFTYIY